MRRRRADTIATLHHVRGALLWAGAFSIGATACLLPLPLLSAYLLADAGASLEECAAALGFVAALLAVATAFLSARNRTLTRTALWLDHALGQGALTRGLEAAYAPTDLEADRKAIGDLAIGVAALAPVFDASAVVLVVVAALAMTPLAGLVLVASTAALCGLAWSSQQRAVQATERTRAARAEADDLWRTAAMSSIVIAARGLTPKTIGAWKKTHAQALALAFRQSEAEQQRLSIMRAALIAVASVLGGLLAWQLHEASISSAGAAALVTAFGCVVVRFDALFRVMPLLAHAQCGIAHLCLEQRSLLDEPVQPTSEVAERASRPAPAPIYAEAR